MEKVQEGGVTILTYWHYYKRVNLLEVDWSQDLRKTRLKHLSPGQVRHMEWTVKELKRTCKCCAYFFPSNWRTDRGTADEIPKTPQDGCWENRRFWLAEMFQASSPRAGYEWFPPETFSRANPSVAKEAKEPML